jgi:2-polyprenyl-6-methoxyphenol hydroxylase-like FAD-dependent oxidoreductase
MAQPTVVISGAGISGPALAHWLSAAGYRIFVVELAAGIRPGGQTVDLRGAGRAVVERMGLMDQMVERSLEQRGVAWVRADGRRRADMPVEAFHGNGLVSKLEILRGDLVDVLYKHNAERVEYRFDTRISSLEQSQTGSRWRWPTEQRSRLIWWSGPTGRTPPCAEWCSAPRNSS